MSHHRHHHHDHTHAREPRNFSSSFAIAVSINLLFVIVEISYAYIANSASLLGDAGHNLGDVLGLIMSWLAIWLTKKKSTEKFSYGYKRTTILAAFFNAVILILATFIIAGESFDKLFHPQAVNELTMMIVAAIAILVNGGTALLFRGEHDLNIRSAFLHLAYDALLSLAVVVIGLIVWWRGWLWLDPVGGLVIAGIILYGSWDLLRHSLKLILDGVPYQVDQRGIEAYLASLADISEVHHVHIWGLSTKEVALTAHLVAPTGLSDDRLHEIQQALQEKFHIHHSTLQVEHASQVCSPCNK